MSEPWPTEQEAIEHTIRLQRERDEWKQRAELAELQQWQDAGIPCPNCGEDGIRVSADPINENYAIQRRVYHCLECNKAWVKVQIMAFLSTVPYT